MIKISEIIPLLEEGYTIKEIAKKYRRTTVTVHRWVERLRKAGHDIKLKRGRPTLKI
jgi:transposase